MKKIGLFLLWLLAMLLLAAVSWGVALYLDWPQWTAVAIFLAFLGSYFLIKALRRILVVMRSRSKMAQPSEASRASMAKIASPEALLVKKWKAAVATLRHSSLKRLGNPLYVLPWYMVIGRSGTGKTSALTRARLASPIQKVSQQTKVEQTLNCDWWFFDRSIVLDCAGRYVGSEDREADKREWELNLDLLAKYRAKEGLNGLVLAIGADRLLAPERDLLDDEGRVIRERIEQLIRLFGKRFPIYLLITKCDQLYGMECWSRQLPEHLLGQAMGYLAEDHEGEQKESVFLDAAFASIGERLRKLRLALVARDADAPPELLLLPNEIERLRPSLEAFLRTCLGNDPYLESPFLRGLFFSSAQQQGGVTSTLLGNLLPPTPAHGEQSTGLFLHDFFGRILPQDRHISRPAALVNHWYRITQNLGLVGWLLFTAAVGTLMTVSFFSNLETLYAISNRYPFNSTFTGRLEDDVVTLDSISDSLIRIERNNTHWKAHWMVVMTNMDDLEEKLKQNFVGKYRRFIQNEKDDDLGQDLDHIRLDAPDTQRAQQAINLVRHINLLRARMNGAKRDQLAILPQAGHVQRYTPELYQRFNALYLSHLAWSDARDPYLQRMLGREREMFSTIADGITPPFTWLVALVDRNAPLGGVSPSLFWKNTGNSKATAELPFTTVAPAFTAAGQQAIDGFLTELETSADNGARFVGERTAFEAWYNEQRLQAWQRFVVDFPSAEKILHGEVEWRAALGSITGPQSPYYRLIDRLNEEFKAVPEQALPDWLRFAREFARLREQARATAAGSQAMQLVGAINNNGGKALKQVVAGQVQEGSQSISLSLDASDTLRHFLKGIDTAAAESAAGPAQAYQLAAEFHGFSRDAGVKSSKLQAIADSLRKLKQQLNHNSADSESIWQLIEGPFRFVLSYTQLQASCSLQQAWESKVQWPLQTATTMTDVVDQLYGQSGSVWAFADGPAKPFLARDANRFHIVETLGFSVPFTGDFLPMLNGAAGKRVEQLVAQQKMEITKRQEEIQAQKEQLQAQQNAAEADHMLTDIKQKKEALKAQTLQLRITGQPTSVTPNARAKPFATVLTLQCNGGSRTLNNFNFPSSENFAWSIGNCGDINLQIKVNDLVLAKKYPGPLGLVRFLQDFRDGHRLFNADEFPGATAKLAALGIRQIGLYYQFEGQENLLKLAQQLEQLETKEREANALKQKALETQNAKGQYLVEVKLAGAPETPMKVSLPERIGVCWDERSTPHKPQTMETFFKEQVGEKLREAGA